MRPSWLRRLALAALVLSLPICAASLAGQARASGVIRYAMTDAVVEGSSPADAKAASLLWARGLASAMGGIYTGAEAEVYPSIREAQAILNAGEIDVLAMSTLEYLTVEQTLAATPMLVWELSGSLMSEHVLVARRDSSGLTDLKNKSLIIFSPNRQSSLSETWTDVMLAEKRVPSGRDAFGAVKTTSRRGHAAMAVFFRQADLGVELLSALKMSSEMNPQLGRDLVILGQSPPLLPGLVCINNRITPEVRRQYVEKATRLHESTRYNQAFLVLRVSRLTAFKAELLDSVRQLVARHRTLPEKR